MTHGDYRTYRAGCRCADCTLAQGIQVNKERWVREHRGGMPRVDAKPIRKMVREIMRRGYSQRQVATMANVERRCVQRLINDRRPRVAEKNAQRIVLLWQDIVGPVAKDERRFPAEPFIAEVIARYGSIRATGHGNDERALQRMRQRGDMSAAQADRWAKRLLDKLPSEIWADAS